MRYSLLLLAATSLVAIAPNAKAQNYVQPRDYAQPGVMVNMDVLGAPSSDPMVPAAPMYSAPLPPPMPPVDMRPPVAPSVMHAPPPVASAPMPVTPRKTAVKSETTTIITPGPAKALTADDLPNRRQMAADIAASPSNPSPIQQLGGRTVPTQPKAMVQETMPPAMPSPIAASNDNAGRVIPEPMDATPPAPTPASIARSMQSEDLPPPVADAKPVMPMPSEPLDLAPQPKAPAPVKAAAPKDNFEAYRLLFDAKSDELKPSEKGVLNKIINTLKVEPDTKLRVQSYAAGTPETAAQARRLSLSRALKMRGYMTEKGIAATRLDIRALGMGSAEMGDLARGDMPADRMDIIFVR